MRFITNLEFRNKLALSFLVIILLFVLNQFIASYAVRNVVEHERNMINNRAPLLMELEHVLSLLNRQRSDELELLLSRKSDNVERVRNSLANRTQEIDSSIQLIKSLKIDNEQLRFMLVDFIDSLQDARDLRDKQILAQDITPEQLAEALSTQSTKMVEMRTMVEKLIAQTKFEISESIRSLEHTNSLIKNISMLVFLSIIVVTVIIIYALNKNISIPLTNLAEISRRVAAGDLEIKMDDVARHDEVGELTKSLHQVVNSMMHYSNAANKISKGDLTVKVNAKSDRDMLGLSLQDMISSLNSYANEVADSVSVVNASVNDLSNASSQLASSASQTSTSIAETTTTIEEVRQASQLASRKAKVVSDLSEQAADVAQSGRDRTNDTNETMKKIKEKMAVIANSIDLLSEQSKAISSIIKTVDDLSQQSNLLAVNASIEAEKAGENGRGFRVVAQEIKNLSDQSKAATSKVREILDDIRKATTVSVTSIRDGNKVVEDGVKNSELTYEAINELSTKIEEAANAAIQIASSSQQQLIGMDQASTAMDNIKGAGEQNVDSAQHLQNATSNLKEIGERLRAVASRLKSVERRTPRS